ncbi:hypothetical protein PRIPAC_83578, partial [Pristionchus pacificus]|uniref:Uncharacterized protein n=1 Tax=Pristionchus pacificus TaxID=54126 RepID=A0A2A6BRZ4_PRIPA
ATGLQGVAFTNTFKCKKAASLGRIAGLAKGRGDAAERCGLLTFEGRLDARDVQRTLTHEIGHSLGAEHDDDNDPERVEQELAQLKNVDSLKLCVSGFSRVLMTMGLFVLVVEPLLAPDDVTSKTSEKFGWGLAQLKNIDSLKLCVSGFSRVLMTMGLLILVVEPLLAPDDLTSKTRKTVFDVTSSGANRGSTTKTNKPIVISTLENPETHKWKLRKSRKTVFDVRSSGANRGSTTKINKPIVISTLENPETQSFRESIFLSCAKPHPNFSDSLTNGLIRKTVFDVTSSGANRGSTTKTNKPIVISTLENPETQSFRESTFLSCANSCSTL